MQWAITAAAAAHDGTTRRASRRASPRLCRRSELAFRAASDQERSHSPLLALADASAQVAADLGW
jgi:hypothetical protein